MSENKNVFITPKGRKYHFYTTCNYIKGRQYQKISFEQAKKITKGPCSSCQHLLEKKGDKFEDDENIEKEEEKEENNNININNEINNKTKSKKKLDNKKIEELKENNNSFSSSSSDSNSFKVEKEKNTKENILNIFNSNFDDISGIKQNTDYNYNSKANIEILKEKINNNNKNEEEEDEDDEKKENVKIINNNINNINKEEEYFNNNNNQKNNSIENMNKLKYNLDPNLPKKDLNWSGKDFKLLEETNKSSQLLFLHEINSVPKPQDKNILILTEKNIENKENSINKGNFKFRFEITPYKELKEQLKISVGFEIDYLEEDNILKKENKKMNLSYETLILIKHFLINKKTNKIHVMINISNGKFFVIGNDELEKRSKKVFLNSENTEILFLKNFRGIKLDYIKDVRPVFEYNINYLKLVNIDVGRNILNDYSKSGKNK